MGEGRGRTRLVGAAWLVFGAGGLVGAGCSTSSNNNSAESQAFLQQVHSQAPDIAGYRSNSELVKLGQAVCNELAAGASRQQVADRIAAQGSAHALPSEDLGTVMTAATATLCPKYGAAGTTGTSG